MGDFSGSLPCRAKPTGDARHSHTYSLRCTHVTQSGLLSVVMNCWALFLGILSCLLGLAMAVPVPGPDRPMKQADYAALSHPANTKTVYASARVEQAVPLSYRRY